MFRKRSSKASVSLYVSLHLTKDASQDDIQKAYHLLQEKYKQDAAEKKKGAKKQLKEIERAYRILGDPCKRAMYDEHGAVGWWGKLRQAASPEAIDKCSPMVKCLWLSCFAATCCCCCYCCHHCCNTCRPENCEHDEDEVYVRANFAEYLTDSSASSSSPFGRKQQKKEIRKAARKRRGDMYKKKGVHGHGKKGEASGQNEVELEERNDGECEEKIDSQSDNDHPRKITQRSLISKDSGCDIGLDNNGFVNDQDGESINTSEFSEENSIESDRVSVEEDSTCTGNQDHSDVIHDECEKGTDL